MGNEDGRKEFARLDALERMQVNTRISASNFNTVVA